MNWMMILVICLLGIVLITIDVFIYRWMFKRAKKEILYDILRKLLPIFLAESNMNREVTDKAIAKEFNDKFNLLNYKIKALADHFELGFDFIEPHPPRMVACDLKGKQEKTPPTKGKG